MGGMKSVKELDLSCYDMEILFLYYIPILWQLKP